MARQLDNWIQSYLEYTASLEAPDAFHFWTAVSSIASALQGKVWIDMGFFKWKPNFFIIFVAPPGIATKSTTIRVGAELLAHVDGVHFGPKSLTWQYITDALTDSTQEFESRDGSRIQTSSITCIATELGTFLDPKNSYMIDMMVDLWDGQDVTWSRGTRGEGTVEVPNPWINFVGACTPSWIAENFPEYSIGGGFVSRTVFVYAEHKRNLIAYPKYEQGQENLELKASLIEDLKSIARLCGEFELDNEAIKWGREWYKELWENRPSHLDNERMASYVARKQTHIHKLAMVLSASQRDSQIIYASDLEVAEGFMQSIEATMKHVFTQVTDNVYARYAKQLQETMRKYRKLTKTQLWRQVFYRMAWSDFETALTACLNAGFLRYDQIGSDAYITYVGEEGDEDRQPDSSQVL